MPIIISLVNDSSGIYVAGSTSAMAPGEMTWESGVF